MSLNIIKDSLSYNLLESLFGNKAKDADQIGQKNPQLKETIDKVKKVMGTDPIAKETSAGSMELTDVDFTNLIKGDKQREKIEGFLSKNHAVTLNEEDKKFFRKLVDALENKKNHVMFRSDRFETLKNSVDEFCTSNDPEAMRLLIGQGKKSLLDCSPGIKDNVECVRAAAITHGVPSALCSAGKTVRANKQFMLECVAKDNRALEYMNKSLLKDLEILQAAAKDNPTTVLESCYVDGGKKFPTVQELWKMDKQIILRAVRDDGNKVAFCMPLIEENEEIVLAALESSLNGFSRLNASYFTNHQDSAWKLIERIPSEAISTLKLDYFENEKIRDHLINSIIKRPYSLNNILLSQFKNNEKFQKFAQDIAKNVVGRDGMLLEKIYEQSRTKDIVIAALQQNSKAKQFVPEKLKQDPDIQKLTALT